MARRSEGRVALVTGGARGIGEATADRLAEDGALIAIGDIDGHGAEAAAARIAARHGVNAIGVKANVAIAADVELPTEDEGRPVVVRAAARAVRASVIQRPGRGGRGGDEQCDQRLNGAIHRYSSSRSVAIDTRVSCFANAS